MDNVLRDSKPSNSKLSSKTSNIHSKRPNQTIFGIIGGAKSQNNTPPRPLSSMYSRRTRKRIRSRSNGNLPFAVTKRSSSADELDDHPDSESVSTSSVSSSNVHHLSVHGLQRQIQNLSTNPRHNRQIPSNLTPPAGRVGHRGRLSLNKIDCEFVASPTGFSSQTPPGIGRDRHMPSLNLHDVQRRKHYSEPMGDRRRHTMNGRNGISGISGVQRTGSISITRSK